MKQKAKIAFLAGIMSLSLLGSLSFFVPQAHASVSSVLSGQICEPDNSKAGYTYNLGRCVNNIYIFSISIASFIAVIMFVFAGYLYVQGSEESVESAKSMMTSTLLGMAILFGAYIILNTIDPSLTTISNTDSLQTNCDALYPENKTSTDPNYLADYRHCMFISGTGAFSGTGGLPQDQFDENGVYIGVPFPNGDIPAPSGSPRYDANHQLINIQQCDNCVNAAGLNVPIKSDDTNVYLNEDLAKALAKVAPINNTWWVTEGWPATVHHNDACHAVGTCADVALKDHSTDPAELKKLCLDLLPYVNIANNEYAGSTASIFTGTRCPAPHPEATTKGGHFHVKMR